MKNPVIIFGDNPMARAAKSIFDSNEVITYGYLTDKKEHVGQEIDEVTVLGTMEDEEMLRLLGKKCEAFLAVDEIKVRKFLVKQLKQKEVMPVNAIHAGAHIDATAKITHGSFINMGVMIGHEAEIGNHCLLHSGAIIEHQVKLGDFVQVGAGSILNSGVTVEEGVFIGTGVTIVSGITIGKGARVGAGSLVIADVEAGTTVFGNPAQLVN